MSTLPAQTRLQGSAVHTILRKFLLKPRKLTMCPHVHASDEVTIANSAVAFMQGFFRPLGKASAQQLANSSSVQGPLNGYQYVVMNVISASSPDAYYLEGQANCPQQANAAKMFKASTEFKTLNASTLGFYQSLRGVPTPFPAANLSFENAYLIFDYLNVMLIHRNASIVSPETFFQLRTLADVYERGHYYNASNNATSIGGASLLSSISSRLGGLLSDPAHTNKLSYLNTPYPNFISIFGLLGLTSENFTGLPDYASAAAFELHSTPSNESTVRFLFRNGTTGSLTQYPIAGQQEMKWADFTALVNSRGISSAQAWCSACQTTKNFCAQYQSASSASSPSTAAIATCGSSLSNVAAGGIGAGVTLAVMLVISALAFGVMRGRLNKHAMRSGSDSSLDKGIVKA